MGTTATDAREVKRLRDETGAGIMDCKKALQESGGDFDKARKLIEQRGMARAEKRAGREVSQGLVEPYIHLGGQIGALVEIDCETDFVSRTPEFRELAHEVAMQIAATSPKYVSMDDIPESDAQEMRETLLREAVQEVVAQGKPEAIAHKMVDGRYTKYAKSLVLLEQEYIRDPGKTIKQLLQELSAKTGENIVIRRFARYQVGL